MDTEAHSKNRRVFHGARRRTDRSGGRRAHGSAAGVSFIATVDTHHTADETEFTAIVALIRARDRAKYLRTET